ncbi:surface antigen [Plasmodium falciparum UGT5.1]|uniref:Surface antigen n=1 Tax=Plasmodium falciparum UGT5.1 TaxID=1237627 RepID=W7JVK6_PLAFA|nr:surface antigen [Plasmodium falciparum UGT5.1]
MKMHYSEILFFSLSLNILITSSYAHNKNKPHITQHTPTNTTRVLSECNLYMPNYDNDADMKSVKENFDRQTSQRFEEYEERIQDKRKKCKEQCDKDIQQIILKDKIEKTLAEKVEKGCLKCGCGLGGVAACVGIFGAIAVNEVKKAALVAAAQKGIEEGIKVAIEKLGNIVGLSQFNVFDWTAIVTPTTYDQPMEFVTMVSKAYYECIDSNASSDFLFCSATEAWRQQYSTLPLETITREAAKAAGAARDAAKTAEAAQMELANSTCAHLYSAIGYSVTAILIIVLVMVIIYLILRYRRKKKMNKKSQYTKLLNQ